MAHYGFTTEDIGSHPNALMSVKKFAHTSIRPYVGECVFDSLVDPIAPIYCAIRKMCKEEACSLSLSNAMDGYAKAVFTAGRTDDDNAKIPAELSAADKAANAKRWKYTSDKGLSLSMRLMKKRGEDAKRPAWRGPSPAMRLMKKQGEEAKAPRLGGLALPADDRECLLFKLQRLMRNDDDTKIPVRTSVMTYGKNGFGVRTHSRWQ